MRQSNDRSTVGSLAWFTVHQFLGTYGIMFVAPYILVSAGDFLQLFGRQFPMAYTYWILTGTPYFPVQILLGLLLGWLIGRHFQHRVMTWIWIIPLIYLLYAFIAVPTFTPNLTPPDFQAGVGESRLSHYFGWGCQPVNHCMDQTTVTLPFYISLSYCLGALLARKIRGRFQRPNPRHFWIYLVVGLFFLAAFCSELRQLVELFRQGGQWHWAYLQPLVVVAGAGGFLILYSIVVANGEPVVRTGRT
ncbi:MAG TPA: hypothetical protein VN822_04890 [Candidatus Acidoferrales bacterium]|nr:hypothetical protein [Candidatus Acidoferrales bacterium]